MALLRLPSEMSEADRVQEATTIINNLGLRECANVRVGSELVKVGGRGFFSRPCR